jgi:HAE1 family hydrophobic/amphiphilic exporter-1
MRGLVRVAVERPVTVVMTALAVVAFGAVGYSRLALELFPDITYPSLTVQTDFPDTAPQEVENLVTRPVEEAVGVLPGLQQIHSVSRPGTSEVTLEFAWGSDMDLLSMEVREKLDRLILPEEAENPIVLRFDPSLEPVLRVALSGPDELTRLRYIAEQKLKLDLETIEGVAAAQVRGGLVEEIHVYVHQERLAALGIPLERVRQVVGISNVNLPGGALRSEESRHLIRTVNEFDDIEEISKLIVHHQSGAYVTLGEVATVEWGAKERDEITRVDGVEAVEIAVYKQADANTVTVVRAVRQKLAEWREKKLTPGQNLTVLFDQSGFVQNALDEVRDAALIGGLLAVLVLYAFLRDLRSTLIIATSIPLSVVATFLAMYRLDISLNIMSLGGLTLGIGMLVDNSIVVLESIFRKRQEGLGLAAAAVEGTAEVGAAVAASTLTTVAVFLPIVFVEGIAGQLFRDQALTVSLSLLASLGVAVTVIPMLSAVGTGARERARAASTGTAEAMTLGRFSRAYDSFVRGALAHRGLTLTIAFAVFAVSLAGLRRLGTELIPALSEGEFFFEVNLPEGASLAATDRVIREMERASAADPAIERTYSTVGLRLVAGGLSLNTKAENLGQVNVVMADRGDHFKEAAAAERLREQFSDVPDLEVKLGRPSYFSLRTPVEVVLYGEDIDIEKLRDDSLEIARDLRRVPGLTDVRSSLEAGQPELQVVFDRRRLASLDLQQDVVSGTLRDRVLGVVATRFKETDRQIDIRVRNLEEMRSSKRDIENLVVAGPSGAALRLSQVAEVNEARGPAEIHRLQQERAAIVSANLEGRSLGAAIADVEKLLEELPRHPGVTVELGGQNREMQVSFRSLQFALSLAVFLVYLVMAGTFESFVHPFIVLFTIPLALIGVVTGLLATGTEISVIVLIGAILLAGVVVNNAIVLIDAINRLRRAGVDKLEAVVRAGHLRLRPILMTTVTTVLGLLPMAFSFGEGAELRAPLAITVLFGLSASTLLTLVVIPALYMVVPSHVRSPAAPPAVPPAVPPDGGTA